MRAVLLAGALVVLAGCADPPATSPTDEVVLLLDGISPLPASLPAIANLTLEKGGGIRLALGSGWGQLRIHTDDVVPVSITRDGLAFTPVGDPEGLYAAGQFTIVRLDVWPDAHVSDSDSFSWIGPVMASRASEPPWTEATLDLDPGGQLVLLTVATTVAGYTLVVGKDPGNEAVIWPLGPHDGLATYLPEAQPQSGIPLGQAEAAYRREWAQAFRTGPSAAYAVAWQRDQWDMPVNGARAGIASAGFVLGPPGTEPPSSGPGPVMGFGTGFAGWSTRADVATTERELVAHYWYESTTVGTTQHDEGLAVVVVPLTAPLNPEGPLVPLPS